MGKADDREKYRLHQAGEDKEDAEEPSRKNPCDKHAQVELRQRHLQRQILLWPPQTTKKILLPSFPESSARASAQGFSSRLQLRTSAQGSGLACLGETIQPVLTVEEQQSPVKPGCSSRSLVPSLTSLVCSNALWRTPIHGEEGRAQSAFTTSEKEDPPFVTPTYSE